MVTVSPLVPIPVISTSNPLSFCAGTKYQDFNATTPPPANVEYSWNTVNAIVWATSSNGMYAVINFPDSGFAAVILSANYTGFSCASNGIYSLTVAGTTAQQPEVIYFDSRFVCIPNNEDSYQWGYDDVLTLVPTALIGEVNQDYIDASPDFTSKYYWVMTTQNDCIQKTYYNSLLSIQNVNQNSAGMLIYPNPSDQFINVVINNVSSGNVQIEIVNMTGQQFATIQVKNNTANIDVSGFPAGLYMVNCNQNGIKIATSRFVKD